MINFTRSSFSQIAPVSIPNSCAKSWFLGERHFEAEIFTARNEVRARLCFHRHVWFCSQVGSASVHAGIPTLGPSPPLGPGTPQEQTPPNQAPPRADTPPGAEHAGRYCNLSNIVHLPKLSICLLVYLLWVSFHWVVINESPQLVLYSHTSIYSNLMLFNNSQNTYVTLNNSFLNIINS